MDARNFRYLFENSKDGTIQSGCIWDTIAQKKTTYLYMAQAHIKENTNKSKSLVKLCEEDPMDPWDIFILGAFTVPYVKKMLELVKKNNIVTIVLPYIPPIQRLVLYHWYEPDMQKDTDFLDFMEHPYTFLKKAGIRHIYFVYGNGNNIELESENFSPGHYFDKADDEILHLVSEMEGQYIPVVKAGYIVENSWLFYYGQFGRDMDRFSQLSLNNPEEVEGSMPFRGKEKLLAGVKKICHEYMKQFGMKTSSTITMFQGPINDSPQEVDSVLAGKIFSKENNCKTQIPTNGRNCLLKCLYQNDYDLLKRHKMMDREESCFGVLLLGNININRCLPELIVRFSCVQNKIRVIALPGCGMEEYWNKEYLVWMNQNEMRYWVCTKQQAEASAVITDLVLANPYNRVVTVSEEYGYCFSGYLVPRVEMEEE
ncbi:hypothetical protein LQZ18_15455 [Lachnospiraceae bacterium ZAX-1]